MECIFIKSEEVNSDLGVVNAARVSLGKHHTFFEEKEDTKLINYLAKNNHWTPFAHSRLYFEIAWNNYSLLDQLDFYKNYNPGGFSHISTRHFDIIKGSLYGWALNLQFLPERAQEEVKNWMLHMFPIASRALRIENEPFKFLTHTLPLTEDYIASIALQEPKNYKLLTATLRVKVPIFIARQIRTSQVGFAYSDEYVESESFVFNEISRRYVSEKPSFYEIKEWRVREGTKVKQGSTGIADKYTQDVLYSVEACRLNGAMEGYFHSINTHKVAPEQARALLPQSMYTEFYMTGTLHRWAQFIALRSEAHVQEETRLITSKIQSALASIYPKWLEHYRL